MISNSSRNCHVHSLSMSNSLFVLLDFGSPTSENNFVPLTNRKLLSIVRDAISCFDVGPTEKLLFSDWSRSVSSLYAPPASCTVPRILFGFNAFLLTPRLITADCGFLGFEDKASFGFPLFEIR